MARLGPRAPCACAASGPPVGHPCPYGPAPRRQAPPPASLARLPVAKRRHRPLWPRRRRRRGGRPSGSAAAAGGRGGASFGWSSWRISCSSACSSPPGLPCAGDSAALAGKYPFFTLAHGAASTAELKCLLQPLTNVLPRGKVLADAAALSSMQVVDGSKVMLIASQGLHQGDGPITKNTSGLAPSARRTSNVKEIQTQKPETIISKSRSERWKLTGVIALSDSSLKAVPEEVWDCGSSIRVLDVSNNCIEAIPHKIGALKSLNKLLLTANDIADGNISWEGLSCLQTLTVLSLNQNRLVTLPSSLGSLTFLRELRIANNRLDNIPVEIGLLKQLEILIASNNRIISLPSSIGKCESLTEVDLSSNLLAELPEAFGNLHNLKALHLRNNGLTSLPSTLFKKCWRLTTLDLHGTEITNDILRQVEGWEEFDERRRQKHQKQLDFRVGSSGVFDEGADDDNKRA